MIIDPTWRGDIIFHTDSSGKSCAGVWGDRWFVYKFTALDNEYFTHISTKELFAVVMACRTYREGAKGKTIIAYCDNEPSVTAINKGKCQDPILMKLVRELFYLHAEFSFQIKAIHLPGKKNVVADALSREEIMHKAWTYQPTLLRKPDPPHKPTLLW